MLAGLPPRGAAWTELAANRAMELAPSLDPPSTSVHVLSAATNQSPIIVSITIDDRKSILASELGEELDLWDW